MAYAAAAAAAAAVFVLLPPAASARRYNDNLSNINAHSEWNRKKSMIWK
jgi:hypothetical protein